MKRLLKACITPAVKLIRLAGITQEIASVGPMKTARTSAMAKKMDFGYSRPGFRSSSTCTALTSTPA